MVKLIQVQEHEILVAMSFWALGHPITCMIGFVMSGIKATGDDEEMVAVSTAMVDGLTYGPANLLLLGVTLVLNMICYAYIRYAIRLQVKEIPSIFPWLYFIAYFGLGLLLAFPPIKVHMSPYDYGVQHIGFQIFMIFSMAWLGYFTQWLKTSGARACMRAALALSAVLLVLSWAVAGASNEKSSAPAEWSSLGIIMACYAWVVFLCERDKVMKLNSSGFSTHTAGGAPQEYEQL